MAVQWKNDSSTSVVSVDWFAVSCKCFRPYEGQQLRLPEGWQQVPQMGTAVWQYRTYIMAPDGSKIATFLAHPKSAAISADRAMVEVANMWLYMDNFEAILEAVLSCYPLRPDGLSRVDLACDFEMTTERWQVFRYLEDGQAYLKALKRGVVWWFNDGGNRIPHQISWGGKDSAFHWKVYWKYKELYEGGVGCTKPYIEELWRAVGMEPKMVWRCEVSITQTNQLHDVNTGSPIPMGDWWPKRVDIFRRVYKDKFVIRLNEGHKDKRHDPQLKFLDLEGEKCLKHKLKGDADHENDVERRIVCKLWKEFMDSEVRCNDFALEGLRQHIMYLFQHAANVGIICRRFKLTEKEVLHAIAECS